MMWPSWTGGYSARGISFLYTAVIILSIPSSFLYERVSKKLKLTWIIAGGVLILALNYLFSPFINTLTWTVLFLIRVVYAPLKKAAITDIINSGVASNIRATTLSTYELLIRIPFVVFGVVIGASMKAVGVKTFSLLYAALLLAIFFLYLIFLGVKKFILPSKPLHLIASENRI